MTAALGVAVTSFALMGTAAPAAEAGLMCQAKVAKSKAYVYSACKGYSGNNYRQVRAVASCDSYKTYGPWVDGGAATSRAYCAESFAVKFASVQLR
ncbi:hypothetical protein [Murinocardiopsis flavida]|uniref:hypothetical protein n=1 Tax=Murinocardiopsis flavida TaxID=645275 RepID=UPI000D0D672A|nr:hypothetical protein [Murinocardiopsis flavida]